MVDFLGWIGLGCVESRMEWKAMEIKRARGTFVGLVVFFGCLPLFAGDTIGTATPVSFFQTPADSGYYVGFSTGVVASVGAVEYWSFEALAGDRVSIHVSASGSGLNPFVELRNAADGVLEGDNDDGPGSDAFISQFVIDASGTYFARVRGGNTTGSYDLRVDVARGIDLESDANNANGTREGASRVTKRPEGGQAVAHFVGSVMADTDIDVWRLGGLNESNTVALAVRLPEGSTLEVKLQLVTDDGTVVADDEATPGALQATIPTGGPHYVQVEARSGAGLRGLYIVDVVIDDDVPPRVVAVTRFPAEGARSDRVISTFSVRFDESLNAALVEAGSLLSGWSLREAGADGVFDSGDDTAYTLEVSPPYDAGEVVHFFIVDGPLPSGSFRFSALNALTDVVGNQIDGNGDGIGGDTFVRLFQIELAAGYTVERASNNTQGSAGVLPLFEAVQDTGYFIGRGVGAMDPSLDRTSWSDPDWWRFEAEAGDRISISIDTPNSAVDPLFELYNAAGNLLRSDRGSGPGGDAFVSHYGFPLRGIILFG